MLITFKSYAINLKHFTAFCKSHDEEDANRKQFGIVFSKDVYCGGDKKQNIVFRFSDEKERDLAFEKIIDYVKSNERVCEI